METKMYPFLYTLMLLVQAFLVIGQLPNDLVELNQRRSPESINSKVLHNNFVNGRAYDLYRVAYPQLNAMYPRLIQALEPSNQDKDYWNPFYLDDIGGDDASNQMIIKRQAKYRQCYFNPVSCFRK